jgi:hypothetical protein
MWIISFYRLAIALAMGALGYFLLLRSLWLALGIAAASRTAWYFVERVLTKRRINRWFEEHQGAFKEEFGPYGIRLINRAESDLSLKSSLAEVFTPDLGKLKANVDNLEAMDALFKAGLRPDGDAWQLHDLKLRYGKMRLERSLKSGE